MHVGGVMNGRDGLCRGLLTAATPYFLLPAASSFQLPTSYFQLPTSYFLLTAYYLLRYYYVPARRKPESRPGPRARRRSGQS